MFFLEVAELVLGILILAFFVTQVLVPLWKRTPMFPFFRTSRKKLEGELEKAKEEIDNALIEREIEKEKEEVSKIKPKTKQKKEEKDGTKTI